MAFLSIIKSNRSYDDLEELFFSGYNHMFINIILSLFFRHVEDHAKHDLHCATDT